ncbi:hypothetical protein AB0B13_17030 [Streptomyces sp. NPDC042898]|uniref:hypothetical protein n=1 Tax=Streptomyces sp. NPDC042898 TaxID=3154334 RepID=UPI003410D012
MTTMLLRLAPQDLGVERVGKVLAPTRDTAASITTPGGNGRECSRPAFPALWAGRWRHLLGLLECVNAGTSTDDRTRTATAALIAMGVDGDRAVPTSEGSGRLTLLGAQLSDAHSEHSLLERTLRVPVPAR